MSTKPIRTDEREEIDGGLPDAENIQPADDLQDSPSANSGAATAAPSSSPAEEKSSQGEGALTAFRKLTAEEDSEISRQTKVTLAFILGGDMLGGQWFRRHFWYMVMLVFMAIVYVSNRYSCQQEMLETKQLSDTLLDRRYKALTRSSQLKEKTRRSRIEESLVDSTLRTAETPSFNLRVE